MKTNTSQEFIAYLISQTNFSIDDAALHKAKLCLLDYLGVSLAGACELQLKNQSILNYLGSSANEVPAIGREAKTNLLSAALINGMSSHQMELDDGHRFGMIHPGSPVISALLPLAYVEKLSGKDLLKGIIIGYEAAIRLAGAMQPAMKEKGYHATGTCGSIGAAIGVATALNFSEEQLQSTLAAAATSASGILEVIRDESELKSYNSGQAALNGLMAALVARAGFKRPNDVLGGAQGFISIMTNKPDLTYLLNPKKNGLAIHNIYVKPYAACRHCHSPIEAVQKIKTANWIDTDQIHAVVVHTYRWAVHLHDFTKIQGVSSAKMSTPYSVAVALITGKAGIEQFSDENIRNKKVIELANKVKVIEDQEITKLVPHKRAAVVEVSMKDGQKFEARVDLPKGEPENPINEEELLEKFTSLALYSGKTRNDCKQIIDIVFNLETRFEELFEYI